MCDVVFKLFQNCRSAKQFSLDPPQWAQESTDQVKRPLPLLLSRSLRDLRMKSEIIFRLLFPVVLIVGFREVRGLCRLNLHFNNLVTSCTYSYNICTSLEIIPTVRDIPTHRTGQHLRERLWVKPNGRTHLWLAFLTNATQALRNMWTPEHWFETKHKSLEALSKILSFRKKSKKRIVSRLLLSAGSLHNVFKVFILKES